MKNLRKFAAGILVLAMIFALTACSSASSSGTAAPSTAASGSESAASSTAAAWKPTEPIHIIGQSEAGSGPDLFIRALQPYLQEELGTSVVVENAPGSGGKIACTQVWGDDPDGYTLLAMSSPLTTVTQVSKNCDYVITEFEHIIAFDITPYCIIVKKGSDITTIDQLVEACKTKQMSNANSGIGGAMYLQSIIMKNSLGIDYSEVPFDGSNPCMLAVMNGDTTFSILPYDTAVDNQDQVTILAVLSDERVAALPDVATMKELGYDFPCLAIRRGVVAPPDTPKEVVDTLIAAFDAAVKNPKFQEWVTSSGTNMDVALGDDYLAYDKEYYDTVMKYKDYLG